MLQLVIVEINTVERKRSNTSRPILNGGNEQHINNYCIDVRELHKQKRPWHKDLC